MAHSSMRIEDQTYIAECKNVVGEIVLGFRVLYCTPSRWAQHSVLAQPCYARTSWIIVCIDGVRGNASMGFCLAADLVR